MLLQKYFYAYSTTLYYQFVILGATSYLVEVTWTVSGEEFNRTVTSESTSLLVDELLPGTLYRFNIQSRVETGLVSSESRVVEETTSKCASFRLFIKLSVSV